MHISCEEKDPIQSQTYAGYNQPEGENAGIERAVLFYGKEQESKDYKRRAFFA